jgi:hypothetical protein
MKTLTLPEFAYANKENYNDATVVKWSGKNPPPPLGAVVTLNYNGLGSGIVAGYFVAAGWLGLRVQLDNPPDWFLKNVANSDDKTAGAFGVEIINS